MTRHWCQKFTALAQVDKTPVPSTCCVSKCVGTFGHSISWGCVRNVGSQVTDLLSQTQGVVQWLFIEPPRDYDVPILTP